MNQEWVKKRGEFKSWSFQNTFFEQLKFWDGGFETLQKQVRSISTSMPCHAEHCELSGFKGFEARNIQPEKLHIRTSLVGTSTDREHFTQWAIRISWAWDLIQSLPVPGWMASASAEGSLGRQVSLRQGPSPLKRFSGFGFGRYHGLA